MYSSSSTTRILAIFFLSFGQRYVIPLLQAVRSKEAARLVTIATGGAQAVKITLRPLHSLDHLNLSQASCFDAQVLWHFLQLFHCNCFFILPTLFVCYPLGDNLLLSTKKKRRFFQSCKRLIFPFASPKRLKSLSAAPSRPDKLISLKRYLRPLITLAK